MRHLDGMHKLALAALIATSTLVIIAGTAWGIRLFTMSRNQTTTPSTNPANYAIGGFPMTGNPAPDFTLTDQFDHSVTLSSLRGHEVVQHNNSSPSTTCTMYMIRLPQTGKRCMIQSRSSSTPRGANAFISRRLTQIIHPISATKNSAW